MVFTNLKFLIQNRYLHRSLPRFVLVGGCHGSPHSTAHQTHKDWTVSTFGNSSVHFNVVQYFPDRRGCRSHRNRHCPLLRHDPGKSPKDFLKIIYKNSNTLYLYAHKKYHSSTKTIFNAEIICNTKLNW